VKVSGASTLPPGSWRLTWEELAERTDATRERLERLVELGILTHRCESTVSLGGHPPRASGYSTRELRRRA
jgi:hypothetical protein